MCIRFMFLDSVVAKCLTLGSMAKSLTSNDVFPSPSSESMMIGDNQQKMTF